jgi:hypothetical protein
MATRLPLLVLFSCCLAAGSSDRLRAAAAPPGQDAPLKLWSDFVSRLKAGALTQRDVRPAYMSPAQMLQFLEQMRAGATWPEWDRQPEVYRVGPLIHFVARLTFGGHAGTFSFTFVADSGGWFLQHFESIVLRLDQTGTPPVSTFPDLPEDQKACMRAENDWSRMVVLFRQMRAAAGTEAAFNMFRDGAGYFVQAKTWVPFLPPARAFILYLCWEQSRLHGNHVTLERLDDYEAVVSIDAMIYWRLYAETGHLRTLITEEDYRRIFETIWRDRATAAGWAVAFEYVKPRCTLRFASAAGRLPGDR